MNLFLVTSVVFGGAIFGLAIGVIFQGDKKALKGSCGGPEVNSDCCMTCPDADECDDAPRLDHAAMAVENLAHVPLRRPRSDSDALTS